MCLISTRFIIYGGQWRQWERQAEGDLPAACYPKPSPHTTSKSSWLTSSSPPYPPACLCSIPGFCDVEPSFPLTWSVNIIAPLLWLPFRRELTHRSFLSACSPFSHDSVYWRVKLFLPPGLWLLFFFFSAVQGVFLESLLLELRDEGIELHDKGPGSRQLPCDFFFPSSLTKSAPGYRPVRLYHSVPRPLLLPFPWSHPQWHLTLEPYRSEMYGSTCMHIFFN